MRPFYSQILVFSWLACALAACSLPVRLDDDTLVVVGLFNRIDVQPADGLCSDANLDLLFHGYQIKAGGLSYVTLPDGSAVTIGYLKTELAILPDNSLYLSPDIKRIDLDAKEEAARGVSSLSSRPAPLSSPASSSSGLMDAQSAVNCLKASGCREKEDNQK